MTRARRFIAHLVAAFALWGLAHSAVMPSGAAAMHDGMSSPAELALVCTLVVAIAAVSVFLRARGSGSSRGVTVTHPGPLPARLVAYEEPVGTRRARASPAWLQRFRR